MNSVRALFLCAIGANGYPWGPGVCSPPMHAGGYGGSTVGLSLAMDSSNSIILSSTTPFKGFFLRNDAGFPWYDPSVDSSVSSICGSVDSVVTHINDRKRTLTQATVDCTGHEGEGFTVTAYVVYRYRFAYSTLQQTFVCSNNGKNSDLTPGGGGQFESLDGMISVSWVPQIIGGSEPESSAVTVYFNLQDEFYGWMGIGFGYLDFQMAGGKKAIVVTKYYYGCSVDYYTLVSHRAEPVVSTQYPSDPWLISPFCTVISSNLVKLEFSIGGSSAITLPVKGEEIFVLLAAGLRTGLSYHFNNFDFKKVDFLSSNFPSDSKIPINPYYLTHGVIFIFLFCVLMPLAGFLILIDRAKFRKAHKIVGVLMIILLATGWILVSPAGDAQTSGNYASFSETEISRSHPSYGTAGAIASTVVFSVGVVLSIFSTLSPKAKKIIRFIHGMAGVALCFYGAFTVWTGWVQLGPLKPGVPALDDSPWLWLSFSLFLTVLYLIVLLVRRGRSSSDPNRVSVNEAEKRRSSVFDILITPDQINEMVLQGRIIFVLDNNVFEVPKTFSHPGGRSVLQLHSGQDVGPYMKGFREFQKKSGGNMKRHSHSADAFKLMNKMMIGRLAPMVTSPVMESQAMIGALPLIPTVDMSPLAVPEVSAPPFIPETSKIEGKIISMEIVNKSKSFPVRLFRVETLGNTEIPVGASVHLSSTTSAVERPYTVIRSENNVVEFCIKIYPTGELTSRLNRMKPGMKILLGNVRGRPPIPAIPSPPAMVVFLAGGTGVTPMISFFKDCSKIALGGYLMWWLRSEDDLFLKRELEDMGAKFGVKVIIFFTEKGDRISLGKILGVFGGQLPVGARIISFVMSGPEGFLKAADDALCELGAVSDRILSLD